MKRVVIIGFGRRGKTLYGMLSKRSDVQVAGVYDPGPEVGIPPSLGGYSSVTHLLERQPADLAIISTPPQFHLRNIELCNTFSIPVLCEKPLVMNASGIRKRIAALKIKVYVGYQFQYDPTMQKALALSEGQKILSIDAWQRVFKPQPKHGLSLAAGGTLLDNSSHFINLLISKFGRPKLLFSSLRHAEHGKAERFSDIFLAFHAFYARVHSDWLSAVGKQNQLTIYTRTFDIHCFENNQTVELFTEKTEHTGGGWTSKQRTYYYPERGLERNLRQDPFNIQATRSALDCMMDQIFQDLDRGDTVFYKKQLDCAITTNEIIDAIYAKKS